MSKYFLPLAASFLTATAAGAITVTSPLNGPDQGPLASETYVIDFETPLPGIVTGGTLHTGLTPGIAAAPFGDATQYIAASAGDPVTIDISSVSTGFRTFSVYVGSVDPGNTLKVFDLGHNQIYSIDGTALPADTGDQTSGFTNRRVFFALGAGETLGSLEFSYDRNAFEFDDVAFGGAVPEPAVWGMMIAGFGLVGVASRRRRTVSVVAA